MEETLEMWRTHHGIEENAYAQLRFILTSFGALGELVQSSNRELETNLMVTGTISLDEYPLNQTLIQVGVPNVIGHSVSTWDNGMLHSSDLLGTSMMYDNFHGDFYPSASEICTPTAPRSIRKYIFEPEPGTRRRKACIRCWRMKIACKPTDYVMCEACSRACMPPHICIRDRYASKPIFSKWRATDYQSKLAWQCLSLVFPIKAVILRHQLEGPVIEVSCCQFEPTTPEQTQLFYKYGSGWKWMYSTPYALWMKEIRLDEYISSYTMYYLYEVGNDESWIGQVLEMAKRYAKDGIVWSALKLWAANRLLMKGWEIGGEETLGMVRVTDVTSSLFDSIPAPRVLQNQLDRTLESYIAKTELDFLKGLQDAMERNRQHSWTALFIAVVITLHVRERDIWRLEYWVLNPITAYKWRHPDTPATLIQKSVHLSNLLLTHLHVCGDVPRDLYDIEKVLRTQQIQRASCRYSWMDESSIDFSLCSLAFGSSGDKLWKMAEPTDFGC